VMFNGRLSRVFSRGEIDITQMGLMMAGNDDASKSREGE